jgi:hypothetical protein
VKQIEWHFKRVNLKEKHLLEKKKDINLLRVSPDLGVLLFKSTIDICAWGGVR